MELLMLENRSTHSVCHTGDHFQQDQMYQRYGNYMCDTHIVCVNITNILIVIKRVRWYTCTIDIVKKCTINATQKNNTFLMCEEYTGKRDLMFYIKYKVLILNQKQF